MDYEDARAHANTYGLLLEREDRFAETLPGVFVCEGATPPATLTVQGERCIVLIGSHADCTRAAISVNGDDCLVVIGAHSTLRSGRLFLRGAGTRFWLGALTTTGDLTTSAAEGRSVTIGDEGMFSNRVTIDTSDGHAIYDAETRQRINPSRDVEVGRHVWLGRDVRISKARRSVLIRSLVRGLSSRGRSARNRAGCMPARRRHSVATASPGPG